MEKRPRRWDYLIKQLQAMELRGTEADRIVGNAISNTLNCRRLSGPGLIVKRANLGI